MSELLQTLALSPLCSWRFGEREGFQIWKGNTSAGDHRNVLLNQLSWLIRLVYGISV